MDKSIASCGSYRSYNPSHENENPKIAIAYLPKMQAVKCYHYVKLPAKLYSLRDSLNLVRNSLKCPNYL